GVTNPSPAIFRTSGCTQSPPVALEPSSFRIRARIFFAEDAECQIDSSQILADLTSKVGITVLVSVTKTDLN
ncbi:hypothetical protein BpHYR1_039122, partial [Brachionus plicatilis]